MRKLGKIWRCRKIQKFWRQTAVANGATKLFGEEIGIPSRSAVGMNVLPGNLPIEIEAIFELYE